MYLPPDHAESLRFMRGLLYELKARASCVGFCVAVGFVRWQDVAGVLRRGMKIFVRVDGLRQRVDGGGVAALFERSGKQGDITFDRVLSFCVQLGVYIQHRAKHL